MSTPKLTDQLDLSLPLKKEKPGQGKLIPAMLILIALIGIANLGVAFFPNLAKEKGEGASSLTPSAQKELAMKLEERTLYGPAIRAWQEYLSNPGLSDQDRAGVWYRIGKLYQEDGNDAQAVESFYRSEAYRKGTDFQAELDRRVQESFEALGKFAALKYELDERTTLQEKPAPEDEHIVAEIGPEKISEQEMDGYIEEGIGQAIRTLTAMLPEEERNKQKEALIKQFESSRGKTAFIQQWIAEELLYRRARELKLHENPEVRRALRDTERKFLANELLQKTLSDEIRLTEGDLETYYKAHQKDYLQPRRIQISHILLKDEEKAREALDRLKGGDVTFEALAKEISEDPETKDKDGAVSGWIAKGQKAPGIADDPQLLEPAFSIEPGKFLEQPVKSEKGFHLIKVRQREEERQKSFADVKNEVYGALRTQKEKEIRENLLEELRQRYNVVVHFSRLTDQKKEDKK